MTQQKFCQHCSQKYNCQEIYQKLGNSKGPSVVSNVVLAFLIPIFVFTVSFVVFDGFLDKAINSQKLQTAINFLLALLATSMCIVIVKTIDKFMCKNR